MHRLLHLAVIALVAALVVPATLSAQLVTAPAKGKRLILKDGNYHLVREWEVQGDRVRFYSTERRDWEEMPLDLVDLEATKNYEEKRDTAAVSAEVEQLSAEEEAERRADEARTPEVVPGIRLPANGGVWLLDTYNGEAQLVEMVQSGSDIHKETGKNILRAAINPFARARQSIRLPGLKARIQAHNADPILFINIDEEEDTSQSDATAREASESKPALDAWAQRFRIAKLERKGKERIVGNLKIAFTGSVKPEHKWVETKIEPVSGGWMRLTPAVHLEPGEYALIEMLGKNQFNLYVWDFGVDPAAPENPSVWKPVQPKPNLTGTSETLILKDQRPRK